MAIELLDPKETIRFIPESEKDADNPTTIHVRPSGARDGFKRNALYDFDEHGKVSINFSQHEEWFAYMVGRIVKIENVVKGGNLTTISDPKAIEETLELLDTNLAMELLSKLMSDSKLTEEQEKN